MAKSVYCVKHEWIDNDGKKLPAACVTHTWHTSYRKAMNEYEKRLANLYLMPFYPNRKVVKETPVQGFCANDGTYELSAARVYADANEVAHLRVSLSAADLQ